MQERGLYIWSILLSWLPPRSLTKKIQVWFGLWLLLFCSDSVLVWYRKLNQFRAVTLHALEELAGKLCKMCFRNFLVLVTAVFPNLNHSMFLLQLSCVCRSCIMNETWWETLMSLRKFNGKAQINENETFTDTGMKLQAHWAQQCGMYHLYSASKKQYKTFVVTGRKCVANPVGTATAPTCRLELETAMHRKEQHCSTGTLPVLKSAGSHLLFH